MSLHQGNVRLKCENKLLRDGVYPSNWKPSLLSGQLDYGDDRRQMS